MIESGTASWTDKSLIASKRFYPRGWSTAERRLRYYSSVFPMVEVDSSYYAMPSARNSELWVERTPPDFSFNVKAFRLFTGHQTPANALPADMQHELTWFFAGAKNIYYRDMPNEMLDALWNRFKKAIEPLQAAGKLPAVHFQFPPWVVPSREWHAHIEEIADRMQGYQLATEFRQAKWFDDEHRDATLEFERQRNFTHVVLDMPQGFTNSLPQIWEATSPNFAIVRLHGRNAETWNAKGTAASDRFKYDYSDEELEQFVEKMERLARHVQLVQGIFNNNFEDQGQRNAASLKRMLGGEAQPPLALSYYQRMADRKVPTQEEFDAYTGAHTPVLWLEVGPHWRCPVCLRTKYQILRWTKRFPKRPNPFMGWVAPLHRHHDHGDKWRFAPEVICDQCNSADGVAKGRLKLPEKFSFAPTEIAQFITCAPHNRHKLDLAKAKAIFDAVMPPPFLQW